MAANVDNNATDSTPIERVHAPKVLLTNRSATATTPHPSRLPSAS